MNNYLEYYNYLNNLNQNPTNSTKMTPNQMQKPNKNNLGYDTDPYTGFIRGNMFSGLYDPYKNYKPQELNPKNEQEHALLLVQMYGFAAHDLGLYLDTNPKDTNAINLRSKYINMYNQALAEYENNYGPITMDSRMLEVSPWAWTTKSWPWEGNK